MTKKEIQQSHLSLMENGSIALTLDNDNGKTEVLRVITEDEITNMMMMFYLTHLSSHPESPMQVIDLNGEQLMVVTVVSKEMAENKE